MMDKITVVKEFTFDSAHYLPNHIGACKNLHGHTYRLQIGVTGEINSETGMVVDFQYLKETIQYLILSHVDHVFLNELKTDDRFPCNQPTAEKMVLWIRDRLIKGFNITFIRLYETPTSYAEWRASDV